MRQFAGWVGVTTLIVGVPVNNVWVGLIVGLIAYYISVQFWPWTRCRGKCSGSGKVFAPMSKKEWRDCPDCAGQGKWRRVLARAEG